MVFSSTLFLFAFLPLFLASYAIFRGWRNIILLCFSLVFYFAGEGHFVLVMVASIAANYVFGLMLASRSRFRAYFLWGGIALNIGLLTVYKYAGFLAFDVLGWSESGLIKSIHLPLGISFFTFQSISYLVDVYRAPHRAERSPIRFATYIAMFPQLIAGPIVRFASIADRLKHRKIALKNVYFGGVFFAVGLAQKVLIADTVAEIADAVFASPVQELSAGAAWLGGVAYSLQIFFDFSGYSAMAIGLGLALGFEFPRNFNFPYIAQSLSSFWRRWHLSLSEWFRDYVYIPLGGSRASDFVTYRNLIIVFLLTGLWHGAAWNFVAWGAWHGTFILLERSGGRRVLAKAWPWVRALYALSVVYAGWILFRAEDFPHAWALMQRHFIGTTARLTPDVFLSNERLLALALGVVLSTPSLLIVSKRFMATTEYGAWTQDHPAWKYATGTMVAGLLFLLAAVKVLSGAHSPFIYFRF